MEETYDIFVGSLVSCATQESVTKLFESFGKVLKVRVLEKTGPKNLKVAFVHFSNEEDALKAIEEMNNYMCNGVPLQVKKSDRWLQRSGEEKSPKGNTTKKPFTFPKAPVNHSSGTIGMWQPSEVSTMGGPQHVKANTGLLARPKADNHTSNKILKESIAVTHVEDPVTFYAYFASKHAELNALTFDLQNVCPSLSSIAGEPVVNQVYGSMYSADSQWYRCNVISIDRTTNRSLVQYIDFGNMERVSHSSLVDLPARLKIISAFSNKCCLKNLAPFSSQSIYEQGLAYLKSLVIDQIVSAVLHAPTKGNTYHVSELNQNGLNIVDSMVQKGYIVHNFSVDANRNSSTHNGKNSGSFIASSNVLLGNMNEKSKKSYVPDAKPANTNYNQAIFNQEKAQLIAENKKLRYEIAQAKGKEKALQTELNSVSQALAGQNSFSEVLSVIGDIEKVRLLRQQLPVYPDGEDYIDKGFSLLKKSDDDVLRPLDKCHRESIQEQVAKYQKMQESILECSDQEEILRVIEERNSLREKVGEDITVFCDSVHSQDVLQRVETFKDVLADLQRVYNPFLKMATFGETELPVEELHNFYTSSKAEKIEAFLSLQTKTDSAHQNFFRALEPASQSLLDRSIKCVSLEEISRDLSELKDCLAEEIKICTLEDTSEASIVSLISQLLCRHIRQELEEMEKIEALEKELSLFLKDLALVSSGSKPPDLDQLNQIRKDRKKLKSQLRHTLADKMDLEENDEASDSETSKLNNRLRDLRCALHKSFLEEDQLVANIAQLQKHAFPEWNHLYPDLGLQEYNKYSGVVKSGLEIEQFDLQPLPSIFSSETQYSSRFMDTPVRIQECQLTNEVEKDDFLHCVLQYSAITHPHLLPVDAVFFTKKCVHGYVQQPLLSSLMTVVEQSGSLSLVEILCVLRDILQALAALHGRGLVHGRLHPSTVYLNNDKQAILDSVPFQPHKCTTHAPVVNGICFEMISADSNRTNAHDVYSFSCLCLWLMYPKVEFQISTTGRPVLTDLPMDACRAQIMDLVGSIIKSPTPTMAVSTLLNHPALNQDLESLNIPDVPSDVPDSETPPPSTKSEAEENEELEENSIPSEKEEMQDADCNVLEEQSENSEGAEQQQEEEEEDQEEDEAEDSDNPESTILAFDSIRLNQCSLAVSETTQNA